MVECRTPEREVGVSKPTAAVLCPWARHFTPRKYWLITQEAVAPSRHDWKIVDWDVKPQHKQTNYYSLNKKEYLLNKSDKLPPRPILIEFIYFNRIYFILIFFSVPFKSLWSNYPIIDACRHTWAVINRLIIGCDKVSYVFFNRWQDYRLNVWQYLLNYYDKKKRVSTNTL